MKHLVEIEKSRLFNIDNKLQPCKVFVSEYKTVWKITIKPLLFAMPICIDWSYKKKDFQNLDQAIDKCFNDIIFYL